MPRPEFTFPAPLRILSGLAGAAVLVSLAACAGNGPREERAATIQDLDSLNRVADHNDSVESNLFFYEEAFTAYKAKFPGVDKPAYMAVAQGKDQAFCLFQPNPAQTCLDVGDKFKSLGLAEPARDAYVAGLLSEGVNGDKLNIRFWSGMAQLHFDWQEYEQAKPYLTKVLEVEKKNKWAKKMLASIPREADAEVKPKPAGKKSKNG